VNICSLYASPLSPNEVAAALNSDLPESSRQEQGWIFGQQSLQTFDVIVVNGALGLGSRPL
jgi:hypothetical protein